MGLFLESFVCDRCGKTYRRVDSGDAGVSPLCSPCGDEMTAAAAAAHATLLWIHDRH